MAFVIVNDYVVDRRMKFLLDETDFDRVEENWGKQDEFLVEISDTPAFAQKTRWCELSPRDYRILIANTLSKVFTADDIRQQAIQSLSFLVAALVRSLERYSDSKLETIKLSRVGALDLVVEYEACLNMEENISKMTFDLIVDNS